ncbi:hypothetical protein Sango_0338700 [Sesamum angolense]|uniref:Myb-like domain-containing protein n=1 Tax=Sesamum angolense TaxID=2727404 RepID=A0AAE1X9X2_9LAMI|nr:hypothetical protein Sango_0338700 [Sesamum angolense]
MAASTNPSGGHSNGNSNNGNSNGGVQENANGGSLSATENSVAGPSQSALRHNPGLSLEWTPEEQSMLEDLLAKYASESNIVRYAKIAQALKDKTVRDVALRCRWMNKKENGKRRKDDHSSRKNKDKKGNLGCQTVAMNHTAVSSVPDFNMEKAIDSLPKSSQVANRSNGPPYAQSIMPMDSDDGISYKGALSLRMLVTMRWYSFFSFYSQFKCRGCLRILLAYRISFLLIERIRFEERLCSESSFLSCILLLLYIKLEYGIRAIGGAAGQLLEQNAHALDQISANFSAFKIHENIDLFCQARNNILSILNDFSDLPEIMKQMPPLPVKLNEELANSILPRTSLPKKA